MTKAWVVHVDDDFLCVFPTKEEAVKGALLYLEKVEPCRDIFIDDRDDVFFMKGTIKNGIHFVVHVDCYGIPMYNIDEFKKNYVGGEV